ncbi:MAG: hypothetical protein OXI56_02965 [bacterium]|nr:hypothetical protein [bacterium]MDE0600738.1 hypothetical protein [bacterium]
MTQTSPTGAQTMDWRDWYRLAAGSFRSMLRVGFSAAGIALLGLALASLLLEVGIVEGGPELTIMEAIGAIAAVGAAGGAILGLGAEASYGASNLEEEQDTWRRAAGRALAGLAVAMILVALSALLPLPEDLPITIDYGRATLRAAGGAGLICSLLVPPLAGWLSVRAGFWKPRWDPYILFGAWAILTMALFSPPG